MISLVILRNLYESLHPGTILVPSCGSLAILMQSLSYPDAILESPEAILMQV